MAVDRSVARRRPLERLVDAVRRIGPGLVAGASDNDPTTVATISVAGAATGFSLSWLVVLVLPMLAAVQICAAQVGVVARKGLQSAVRELYGMWWGFVLLAAVMAVNLITIAADLEGGAAAIGMVLHADLRWFVVPYAAVIALVLFKSAYDEVERVLRYVVLVFLAYIAAALLAHPNWRQVLLATVLPHVSLSRDTITAMLAILGTTLTSYAYVWETEEEVESGTPLEELRFARREAGFGMAVTVAVFWFTLIAVGSTLGVHHQSVQTAQDAALALRPAAGPVASYLFAIGLLASSFIAVPVLAATSGYLVCELLDRPGGLSRPPRKAPLFYATLAFGLVVAGGVSLAGIPAISLLFWASIAGGLGTPISLFFLLMVGRSRNLMGGHVVAGPAYVIAWLTWVVVTLVSAYFLWDQVLSRVLHL